MALFGYRNTGTNQVVWLHSPDYDNNPLWEPIEGTGGAGDVTEAELDTAIGTHTSDSTAVHGIADTAALATLTNVDTKISTHTAATDPHGDRNYADTQLTAHTSDTTGVHGITDTAALVTSTQLNAHAVDTTSVHGIADTSLLATTTQLDAHAADTTSIHGIADTTALITTTQLNAHAADTTAIHGIADTTQLVIKGEVVINVADYGAVGDGSTNDTTAVNAAIAAAPAGSRVMLAPGKNYSCAGLLISGKTHLVVDGNGAQITWRATGARVGLQLSGTCTNVTIQNLRIVGNQNLTDAHAGIYCGSGQTLTNIKVLNNFIKDCTLGVSFSADGSGTLQNILIEGNHIDTVWGTGTGLGYGLHHSSSATDTHQMVKFVNNTVINAQRHGIYQAKGLGVLIIGNHILDHRSTVANGSLLSAIMIARSGDVSVFGNVVARGRDSAMTIGGPANGATLARGIVVTGNSFSQALDALPFIVVGQQDPTADGFPDGVTITGNGFYSDLTGSSIQIYSGKHVLINANIMESVGSSTASLVRIVGQDETAGTADYTDDITVSNNQMFMAAGGTKNPINIVGVETTAIRLHVAGNRIVTPGNIFLAPTPATNPNISVVGQRSTGLTFASGVDMVAIGAIGRQTHPTRITSSAAPTPNSDTDDMYAVTALTGTATIGAPTGTPTDGQPVLLRIKDNGTARTLAWNAIWRAVGVTLPTTTVLSKTLYVGARYNAADTKWDVLTVQQEA